MSYRTMYRMVVAVIGVGILAPVELAAQVGNALPQSVAMGGNYVSLARGFGAVLWNPAGLGMPDNPGLSLTLLPVTSSMGLSPVTPGDLAGYDGQLIPHQTRVEWLDLIQAEGGESGNLGADLTYLALSVGRVGLSASTNVRARANVAPDVAEILFFGNAGLTGEPRDYSLDGSNFDVAGTTTLAASYAMPLRLRLGPLPDQHFAVGATVKYTIGNFLVLGREQGSTLGTTPLDVQFHFPLIHTAMGGAESDIGPAGILNNGTGVGIDVGAAWQSGIFSAGASIRNLVNTFAWDTEGLQYRAGTATWTADTSYTNFEEQPFAEAPAELVDRIDRLYTFSPILAAGAAARVLPFLTVAGEVRHALEETLDVGERSHVGVGAELTIVPFLPLRAGVALVSGGYQLSGGLGLKLGPMQLSAAAAMRDAELGSAVVGSVGMTFGVR